MLDNFGVNPNLLQSMKRQVHKVNAELTLEKLDKIKIDYSFGSLVRFAEMVSNAI